MARVSYSQRITELLPAEAVALFLALSSLVDPNHDDRLLLLWLGLISGGLLTIAILWFARNERSIKIYVVFAVTFFVWAFAIAGAELVWRLSPLWWSALLIIWTAFLPLFVEVGEPQG